MKKTILLFEYYKSTLPVNLGFSALGLLQGSKPFFILFCTIGFFLAVMVKETRRKNEYYFYYNSGLDKVRLIVFSFCVNIIISFIISIFI